MTRNKEKSLHSLIMRDAEKHFSLFVLVGVFFSFMQFATLCFHCHTGSWEYHCSGLRGNGTTFIIEHWLFSIIYYPRINDNNYSKALYNVGDIKNSVSISIFKYLIIFYYTKLTLRCHRFQKAFLYSKIQTIRMCEIKITRCKLQNLIISCNFSNDTNTNSYGQNIGILSKIFSVQICGRVP